MTLVNRVSAFFLAALAVCLFGCSLSMWALLRWQLYSEFDGDMEHALNVLIAAVEVEPDGAKWQPLDHTVTLGKSNTLDDVRWIISDENGSLIDHSRNVDPVGAQDRGLFQVASQHSLPANEFHDIGTWRYVNKRLAASIPKPLTERDFDEFAEVQVTVGRDLTELRQNLGRLLIAAIGLPGVLWLLAAIAGRAYCRRALRPVSQMAVRAASMTGRDFHVRLPVSNSHDELSSLGETLNRLLDRLQVAFEQQQRFAGDAAHQLRTPLTVLRGELDLALRRPRSAEEYLAVLRTMDGETSQLQEIVEALLFLARSEGQHFSIESEPVAVQPWLPRALHRWHSHVRHSDLHCDIQGTPIAMASPNLLGQMLDNLVGNAFKYSPPGTPITVTAAQQGDQVCLSVQDRGAGISVDDQKTIFEPFFRTAEARKSGQPGTGLGLTIVARLAKALGGRIECSSQPGTGTQFRIFLPAAPETALIPDNSFQTPRIVAGSLT